MAEPIKRRASVETLERLAEAYDAYRREEVPCAIVEKAHELDTALAAYRRETAPLRSKAEVDAERLLNLDAFRAGVINGCALINRDEALCREETAPEPAPSKECDWCQDSSRPPLHRSHTPERIEWVCRRCLEERGKAPNRVTDHDADTRELQDPEPCGCEEAEALKRELHELKFRQATIHGIASQDRPVTGVELGRIAKLSLP